MSYARSWKVGSELGGKRRPLLAGGIWVETRKDRKRPATAYDESIPGRETAKNTQVGISLTI